MLKCAVCGKDSHLGFLRLGPYCSGGHREVLLRRYEEQVAKLRREDASVMPERFSLADFERFTLKLAVHLLSGMSKATRELYRRERPTLLDPMEMALELKERVLRELPASHVRMEEATGPAGLLHGGSYSFLMPVPAALVRQALEKADLSPILLSPGA